MKSKMKNQFSKTKKTLCIAIISLITVTTSVNAQTSSSSNQDINKAVKVLDDKILASDFDLSSIEAKNIESLSVMKPDSINKVADLVAKYGENAKYGVILIKTKKREADLIEIKPTEENDEKIYQVVQQMPQFPGGETGLLNFICRNIKYPVNAQQNRIQGRVIVRFVVSKTGQVDRVEVIRSLFSDCDKEAVRVIKLLPKFIPGKQNGENVAVWYTLPISFKLQ